MILGSLANAIMFNKWSSEKQFAIIITIASMAEAAAPWTGSLYGYAALRFLVALMIGFGETGIIFKLLLVMYVTLVTNDFYCFINLR